MKERPTEFEEEWISWKGVEQFYDRKPLTHISHLILHIRIF